MGWGGLWGCFFGRKTRSRRGWIAARGAQRPRRQPRELTQPPGKRTEHGQQLNQNPRHSCCHIPAGVKTPPQDRADPTRIHTYRHSRTASHLAVTHQPAYRMKRNCLPPGQTCKHQDSSHHPDPNRARQTTPQGAQPKRHLPQLQHSPPRTAPTGHRPHRRSAPRHTGAPAGRAHRGCKDHPSQPPPPHSPAIPGAA